MKRALIVILFLLLFSALFSTAGQTEKPLKCKYYEYIVLKDGTAEIIGYEGPAVSLEIPGSLNGLAVTSIGDGAFSNCIFLKEIIIPDSVTNIGNSPFTYCYELFRVVIHPDHPTLATIDGALFSKADKRLVWYPKMQKDTAYEIPQGILSIGVNAFYRCENLSSITIPDSVTSIGYGAFSGCEKLSSITIPNSVINIVENPFTDCTSLNQIIVHPDHPVLAIIDGALISKKDKRLIWYPMPQEDMVCEIPQGIQSIGIYAFFSCENLTGVTFPDSITSIDDGAFYNCKKLKEIILPDSVINIGYKAFAWCENLSSISLPDSVISIGKEAFSDCRSLSVITIPDSVTSIGDWAFGRCDNLSSISIPGSVTSIGNNIFFRCSSLQKVIVAPDSYAQEYCEVYGLPFVYQENTDWLNK